MTPCRHLDDTLTVVYVIFAEITYAIHLTCQVVRRLSIEMHNVSIEMHNVSIEVQKSWTL